MESMSDGFSQVKKASQTHAGWPLLLLAAPAGVATWSGWVELGKQTGFGRVAPLPGIADDFVIDTSILLPIGVEAYGAYALSKWLTSTGLSESTRKFAKWSALGSLALGMGGQVAYHLLAVAGVQPGHAPSWLVAAVACLPVLVLGLGAGLHHMIARDASRAEDKDGDEDADARGSREEVPGVTAAGGGSAADREGSGASGPVGARTRGQHFDSGGCADDVREGAVGVPPESELEVTQPIPVVPSVLARKRKRDVVIDRLVELDVDLEAAARAGAGSEEEQAAKREIPKVIEWAADHGLDMDRSYGYDILRRDLRSRRSEIHQQDQAEEAVLESAEASSDLAVAVGGEQ